ncbi:MAG: D-alanyl-D-alanine carboxypeptidase/D-alanyl-D-alanine-endopeptidase [Gemmatimonadales bacterium]|nr:MAG: D-alanyl-D-alanine carboxypeptidase/D-alanyl-D-alanine-endopeptidase [Gemmatimonadales bacterium]
MAPGRGSRPRGVSGVALALALATGLGLGIGLVPPGLAAQAAGASPGAIGEAPVFTPDAVALEERIDRILRVSPMDRVHWGIAVFDPVSGTMLYSRNAQLPFVPASNMKLPVTYGAMALLGPEYRWDTGFWTRAGIRPDPSGTLPGDLVLAAGGDPTLGPPFHRSADEALAAVAGTLAGVGLRRVEGQLLVDVSAWDSTSVPSAWMVGNLSSRSAATGGAFSVGSGELHLEVTGAATAGGPARVTWRPLGHSDFVDARVLTGPPGTTPAVETRYQPESRRWIVEGVVAPGARVTRTLAHRDPVRQSTEALARALAGAGVEVSGGIRIIWDRGDPLLGGCAAGSIPRCPEAERLSGLPSAPLYEVARAILEPSQNWMTEQLVRTVGAELGDEGSWSEGFRVLSDFLVDEVGVDAVELHWRDGSGLSAYNLISPRAVIRILDDARSRPWFQLYRMAQAEPGREDSTLRTRLLPLAGRLFAKTGTISHVNALSGYVMRDDGSEVIFSVITNTGNLPAASIRNAMDEVVMEISRR